jgi:predicted nucleic acid-binding protein
LTGHLLDTSVVIAADSPDVLPENSAISVVTLGELRSGVLLADDPVTRAKRNRTLARLRSLFLAFEVDSRVAEVYGEVYAFSRLERRISNRADLMIIATASVHAQTLYTLDKAQGKLAEDLGLKVEIG